MADTAAAATAASSAPAASFLAAQTGAGSPWVAVRLRPTRWLPSRRPLCHLLSGQPRTLNESLPEMLQEALGTARTALGRALDPI